MRAMCENSSSALHRIVTSSALSAQRVRVAVSRQARRPLAQPIARITPTSSFDRQHGVAARIGGAVPDQHDVEVIAAAWITVLSHSPVTLAEEARGPAPVR
jgi:hypothetical protein